MTGIGRESVIGHPGEEHWASKGEVDLFLWRKRSAPNAPVIVFVHGSSMSGVPTFDLQVPGRADTSAMDWFANRGFDTWCIDMEG
jgi:non-heme chloroperoxidase